MGKKRFAGFGVGIVLMLLAVFFISSDDIMAAAKLNLTGKTMLVGEKVKLRVSGTSSKVSWKSSKPSVVKVSAKGTCTAKSVGKAKVTASFDGKVKTCKIKVNKTFGSSTDSITLDKNRKITLTLTENGAIKSARANAEICRLKFGEWNGDMVSVTIVPLKVGSTKVTFSNTSNSETCVLKVKVKSVPIETVIDDPVTSTGARDFVVPYNKVSYSFTQDKKSENTKLRIYDSSDVPITTIDMGSVPANKKMTAEWNGMTAAGAPYEGAYTIAVIADGYVTESEKSYYVWQRSPFGGGDGSEKNPFLISNPDEFRSMPFYDGEGVHFVLENDIDFHGSSVGEMFAAEPLKGTISGEFDNTTHAVRDVLGAPKNDSSGNVTETGTIIGNISETGVVSDITFEDIKVTGASSVLAVKNKGTIRDVRVEGTLLCRQASSRAGMLVNHNYGNIEDCFSGGSIMLSMENVVSPVKLTAGGIAGVNMGRINGCNANCSISGVLKISSSVEQSNAYGVYIGGIVGENDSLGIVSYCTFGGELFAESSFDCNYYGGICGINDGIISNCSFNATGMIRRSQGSGNGV